MVEDGKCLCWAHSARYRPLISTFKAALQCLLWGPSCLQQNSQFLLKKKKKKRGYKPLAWALSQEENPSGQTPSGRDTVLRLPGGGNRVSLGTISPVLS